MESWNLSEILKSPWNLEIFPEIFSEIPRFQNLVQNFFSDQPLIHTLSYIAQQQQTEFVFHNITNVEDEDRDHEREIQQLKRQDMARTIQPQELPVTAETKHKQLQQYH